MISMRFYLKPENRWTTLAAYVENKLPCLGSYADEDFPLETITETSVKYPYALSFIRKGRKWIETGGVYHA